MLLVLKLVPCGYTLTFVLHTLHTLVGIGTLEFTPVRPSVRASVPRILNDYPLFFSEILHGVTTLYGRKCNILGFLKIILIASPGARLWLKKPQNALKWLKMTLFAS